MMSVEHIEIPEHEHTFLRRCIEEGHFENVNAVVVAGLRLLEQQQRDEEQRLEQLRAEVQKGMDDLNNGRYTEISTSEDLDKLFEEVQRRAKARLRAEVSDSTAS